MEEAQLYSIRMKKTHGGPRRVVVPGVGLFDIDQENPEAKDYPEKKRKISERTLASLIESGRFELTKLKEEAPAGKPESVKEKALKAAASAGKE